MSMHIKPLTPIEEAGLRAHGLPVGKPSQLADAFRLGMAWADKARTSPWKSAVIDQLVIAHILTAEHESDPLKAIQDLLAYHADVAVDPRVSGAAATLVEQAKAEEREACAKLCEKPRTTPLAMTEWCQGYDSASRNIAAAIRARGQQ